MKNIFNYILSGSLILGVASCSEDEVLADWIEDNPVPATTVTGDLGTLDFSNYVAIGNSLTAGFMDGALYNDGQSASYVNMIGTQASLVGGGDFNQPDINSVYGFNGAFSDLAGGNIAGRSYLDLSVPGPAAGFNGELIGAFSGSKADLNNFGVPGMRIGNVETAGYGHETLGNPYFARFAADPNTSSVLGDALATNPTFFSVWIGANDYLGYALSGGQGNDPLTDLSGAAYAGALGSMLTQLTAGGVEGVVIDLPPVVTLPFFQAVSYNAIPLDATTADAVNAGLAAVNGAMQALADNLGHDQADIDIRKMSYAEGQNAILVIDETLSDLGPEWDVLVGAGAISAAQRQGLVPYEQSRPLTAADLPLLSAVPLLGTEADGDNSVADTPYGVVIPLGFSLSTFSITGGDQYYLDVAEQTAIVTARATYNGAIAATVAGLNGAGADIALVTVQDMFADALGLDAATAAALALPTGSADGVLGLEVDGFSLTPDFAPSGLMSTDAVHPNPRGHAVVANLVIDAINAKWGASIPSQDVLSQRAIYFSEN